MSKTEVKVRLYRGQVDWLDKMQKEPEYGLPDLGKTLRCCVNFASQTDTGGGGQKVADAAALLLKTQQEKFTKGPGGEAEEVELGVALAKNQVEWLQHVAGGSQDFSDVTKQLMAICMSRPNPDEVFGVVRCNSGTPEIIEDPAKATEGLTALAAKQSKL